MKPTTYTHFAHRTLATCIAVIFMSTGSTACADVRDDAFNAVFQLHQSGASQHMPDDMKSLDATLADAEQYNELADRKGAENLYLMTLQKAQIIDSTLKSLLAPKPLSPAPEPQVTDSESELPSPDPVKVEHKPESTSDETLSAELIGGVGVYTVQSGDTIRLVASKLGVTIQHLIMRNRLDAKSFLKIGQKLAYNNRKIIPKQMRNGIVVNIPDRTLYYFQHGNLVKSLPVALGTSTKNEKHVWQTPVGKFKVTAKQKDPTWYIPSSIQSEMEEAGKEVITSMPPGPENPLGKYAIKTSIPGILIHSTTKPWSIYSFASHGCIRVSPAEMEDFFKEVKINMIGEIIYKPVKLAVTESGRIFLEVHRDIYKKGANDSRDTKKTIEIKNLADRVDWKKFENVMRSKSGVAEDITL